MAVEIILMAELMTELAVRLEEDTEGSFLDVL